MLENVAIMRANDYLTVVQPVVMPMVQVEKISKEIIQEDYDMKCKILKVKSKPYWKSLLYGLLCGFIAFIYLVIRMVGFRVFDIPIMLFWPFVVGSISAVVMFILLLYMSKEEVDKVKYEYSNKLSSMIKNRNNMTNEIYGTLQQYVPQEYWYSYALQKITYYLANGRAISPMQAFNLYEEEMHMMRMEQMQRDIVIANQRQAFYSAISAVANISTAINVSSINSKLY